MRFPGLPILAACVSLLVQEVSSAAVFAPLEVEDAPVVSVRFYGESQCPYCRKFVTEIWDPIWKDTELRQWIDYDFVPWGNAYFATDHCGSGPYNSQERACWYQECILTTSDDEEACFGSGKAVYQHGEKEGQIDIYESCILQDVGLDAAVEFTYCAEGPNMDDESLDAQQLMETCAPEGVDASKVHECFETRGTEIEIANSKKTPEHPGVPYVLVDGKPVDDPFATHQVICNSLAKKGVQPKSCSGMAYYLRKIKTYKKYLQS